MKKIRVQDAIGMALCHDITEMNDGFKGVGLMGGQGRGEAGGRRMQTSHPGGRRGAHAEYR